MQNTKPKLKESWFHPVAEELERELVNMAPLVDATMRKHIKDLRQWLDTHPIEVTQSAISPNDTYRLRHIRDHIYLAANNSHRLDGEDGIPASQGKTRKTEDLLKVASHIDRILEHSI